MATLKDVQESQGRVKGGKSEQFVTPDYSVLAPETAEGTKQYVIFRLVKKKKGRIHIDGRCDNVLNPTTKKRERIHLIQGADSIWQSDLLDLLKDKDYLRNNYRMITFENGVYRCRIDDERALEFLRANNKNVGKNRYGNGKWDYYEYDAAEEQKERLKKQMLKIEMVIKAKELSEDKMMKLAAFLGIPFIDELGMPKGPEGIRSELMLRADNDPENFSKYLDSPEVEIAYMVRRAILDAKIDLQSQHGNAIWAGGKGLICKIPADRKPYQYLTELAMTNSEDGRRFKEQLQTFA